MTAARHDPGSGSLDPASGNPREIVTTAVPGGDPMSDVLEAIRLRGALFFLWEPSQPYGVGVADGRDLGRHIVPGTDCVLSYHVVERGPCWAAVHGEPPLRLDTGDILLLPRGDSYKIGDSPQYPTAADAADSIAFFRAMAAGEIPTLVRDGGGGTPSGRLICGFLGCDLRPFNPLLDSLPRMIRIPAPTSADDPLSALIGFALSETRQARGGERCLLMRLAELMFVEVLRRYLRQAGAPHSGWLDGLRHPLVGRALAELHRGYAESWTLQRLAREVGASRSTLAQRFHEFVGEPPMQYLAKWRMQVAANRLRDPNIKVYQVATEVGYESEAAFSRAFKRIVGEAPQGWRRRNR